MLLAISALKGYAIEATDGRIGEVSDLLFDDQTWKIRWIVVDTGKWLSGRKVLLHPSAIGQPDYVRRQLRIKLSKAKVEASPDIFDHQPVSMRMESQLFEYYQWDPYWGSAYFPLGAMAYPLSTPSYFGAGLARDEAHSLTLEESDDPHLRSVAEVHKYHVHATDGEIGHVDNFLIDDANWDIRYLIVEAGHWWSGKQVLVSPFAVSDVNWFERYMQLNVTREAVKSSPPWDPAATIIQDYEQNLHRHYGWPGYGWF